MSTTTSDSPLSKVPDNEKSETKMNNEGFASNFATRYGNDRGEGAIDGVLTETLQNIYDAYVEMGLDRPIDASFEVTTEDNKLVIKDNAGGMPMEALAKSFTNIHYSYKAEHYETDTGGFHGIGTVIYLNIADYIYVETKYDEDKKTRKAVWQTNDKVIQDHNEDKSHLFEDSHPEIAEKLRNDQITSPSGTRIEIHGIKDKYLEGDNSFTSEEHIRNILRKWWNNFLAKPNFQLTYIVDDNYHNFTAVDLEDEAIDSKTIEQEDIGDFRGTNVSKYIERIRLYEFENKRPESFTEHSIYFDSHTGQTISHYKPHGIEMSKKVMAVVETTPEARSLESTNHRKYTSEDDIAHNFRQYVKQELKEFVDQKVSTNSDSTLTQSQVEAMDKGREFFNRIAGKMDGFDSIKNERTGGGGGGDSPDYDHPHIHSTAFTKAPKDKNYDYDQEAQLDVRVMNPEDSDYQKADVEVSGTIYHKDDPQMPIAALKPEKKQVGREESERFSFKFQTPDDSHDPGRYHVKLEAKTEKKSDSYETHSRTAMFRLDKEKEEGTGTQQANGIKKFDYAPTMKEEGRKGKRGKETIIVNENHSSFKKFKQEKDDDEDLFEYGFKVALEVVTDAEIREGIERADSEEEALEIVHKKTKDRDIADARYSNEVMNTGAGSSQ